MRRSLATLTGPAATPASIAAPTALCVSTRSTTLYLASAHRPPAATSTAVYRLDRSDLSLQGSIEIRGMGHVTGITEDPATGTIWVIGFTMDVPQRIDRATPLFTTPMLATVEPDRVDAVTAVRLEAGGLALPLSILRVNALPGDADRDGDVDLADLLRFQSCFTGADGTPPAGCEEFDRDRDVDLADFLVFEATFTAAR